ncbi:MAG: phosphonate ABC transporter substrate-binding protein [Alphaproteobacteria bacterium]|nr:phosphonate ABC transporter substrate-binding protein [Alphaproteobacteria bacterium]
MELSRRSFSLALATAVGASMLATTPTDAADWRKQYPELTLGVITSENEADRIQRYKPVRAYLEKQLGVKIKWRSATDYAGIIEGVKAKKIEIARFGPASYAKAWLVMNGKVEPLVGELDKKGNFGYNAVVIVKKDSAYKTIKDLKGKKFAFADPNSTSGHQAPRYFLNEMGIDADKFFGKVAFSGSHENSVMALYNGTFDGAATWWRSEERSNMQRMESKGMIKPGQYRIIWKSPKLPSSPWAMANWLPQEMRNDVREVLYNLPKSDPAAWKALTDGKASAYRKVTHEDYEAIVRMIKHNLKKRRSS